ncbi:hypothetical protein [Alkalihalobacillus sp. LMS39]|uniref:hypothetical protein n=1 Tax=Alkalihalobacillus sp. LMS39 TaxID=2924032 RepID=UPI001FB237B6|nr:hypothetical protein [Alkalihalobacillus sp. LMS39]UOE94729.1 hypothetical protein MM271_03525 [Alkalihalobacillus sp. LMS39]
MKFFVFFIIVITSYLIKGAIFYSLRNRFNEKPRLKKFLEIITVGVLMYIFILFAAFAGIITD